MKWLKNVALVLTLIFSVGQMSAMQPEELKKEENQKKLEVVSQKVYSYLGWKSVVFGGLVVGGAGVAWWFLSTWLGKTPRKEKPQKEPVLQNSACSLGAPLTDKYEEEIDATSTQRETTNNAQRSSIETVQKCGGVRVMPNNPAQLRSGRAKLRQTDGKSNNRK